MRECVSRVMSSLSEDQSVSSEGHVLLLMEITPNKRTFSDYANMFMCLRTMVNMFEEYKDAADDAANGSEEGDLKEFLKWLHSMHRVECFQYTKELNRYKRIPCDKLADLFGELEDEKPTTNGPIAAEPENRPNSVEDIQEDQLDYDDDDDAWDR